jgi:exonuclease SbcC
VPGTDRRSHPLKSRLSAGRASICRGDAEEIGTFKRPQPQDPLWRETFLASLALALALVELHSRSGARLGALFLDEGFGSLDVDALASSLTVLQSETGEDKLVAVISHLHAVAEAVEDVLWADRQPEGSSVRWLTAEERDALVRQEVAGLLNLI